MKKHLIVIGTAVLLLAVGLSGCIEGDCDVKIQSVEYEVKDNPNDDTCILFLYKVTIKNVGEGGDYKLSYVRHQGGYNFYDDKGYIDKGEIKTITFKDNYIRKYLFEKTNAFVFDVDLTAFWYNDLGDTHQSVVTHERSDRIVLTKSEWE